MLPSLRPAALAVALATCALAAALAPLASAQVVIRERVELPPPEGPTASLGADPACFSDAGGVVGPFTVSYDGAVRAVVVLSTYGDAADPAYVSTPRPSRASSA